MSRSGTPADEHSPFGTITHIRTNPGMYIGNTQAAGMRYLIGRLLQDSFDEARSGRGRIICARLRTDGVIEIADDGRGPLKEHETFDSVSAHAAFIDVSNAFRRGAFGRWPLLSYCVVTNAITDPFEVEFRDGDSACRMTFRKGELISELRGLPPAKHRFTIAFRFDPELFGKLQPESEFLRNRLRELAMLNNGVRAVFEDSDGDESQFHFENGFRSYVEELGEHASPIHPDVLSIRGGDRGVAYDISLQWCRSSKGRLISFMNDEEVRLGGTHITGLRMAIAKAFNEFARKRMSGVRPLKSDELIVRLNGVVSLRMCNPLWESSTRSSIGNPELRGVLQSSVRRELQRFMQENPDVAERIVRSCANCQKPLRSVECQPSWRTSTAVAIAKGMINSLDFASMTLLADALEDAGCDHADILEHCRDDRTHVHGCWVVNLMLGSITNTGTESRPSSKRR